MASPQQVAAKVRHSEERIIAESDAAIEMNRKGEAVVRVLDVSSHAVSGAKVVVEQAHHDFLFGCNIFAFDRFKIETQNEEYKRRFAELFNYATTDFYWKSYEREPGKRIMPSSFIESVLLIRRWRRSHGGICAMPTPGSKAGECCVMI